MLSGNHDHPLLSARSPGRPRRCRRDLAAELCARRGAVAGHAESRRRVHRAGRDDSGARRRPSPHQGLHTEEPDRAAADHPAAHAVWHRGRGRQLRALLQGAGGRRLCVRVPGHPRQVRLRRHVRDAAPGPRSGRHHQPGRGHRHLRHDRVAAEERAEPQRPHRHARGVVRRMDHHHGGGRAASGAEGDLAAGLAGGHVARRRLPSQRRLPSELRL